MKTLNFKDIESFIDYFDSDFCDNERDYVSIVAKYKEAKDIVCEMICEGFGFLNIELGDPDITGYENEYVISILSPDEAYCEKLDYDCTYSDGDSIVYFFEDCNDALLDGVNKDFVYTVSIGEKPEDTGVTVAEERDENGFTLSKKTENGEVKYSYYSSDKDEVEAMHDYFLKLIGGE